MIKKHFTTRVIVLTNFSERGYGGIGRHDRLKICYHYWCGGSTPPSPTTDGEWRSLVAHLVWDQRVAGSNPAFPTIKERICMKKIIHVNQHKIRSNTKNGIETDTELVEVELIIREDTGV